MIKKIIKKITPSFLLSYYHYSLALIGSVIFWFPSRKLIVIGITGTSGKSTTVDFTTRILEEAGNKVASISSVRFKIGQKEWKNELKMTTPGRFKIQKFLRQAVKEGCKYAVLEIASEGIKQHRHRFIHFHTAVFTNLSLEHIESHGGFENYRNEKIKLFKATWPIHIINNDDQNARYFLEVPAAKKVTFGIKTSADIKAENIEIVDSGLVFKLQALNFKLNVLGSFNVYNALAAITVAVSQGISLQVCAKALQKATNIPGRMEIVTSSPFTVIVDYAHTPEQLEQAYKSLAPKPLVCVLGSCGGGRDKWKRPVLGKIAQQYCSQIIITNEDPYDEDPLEIMEQIAAGIDNQVKNYHIILDRKEAIENALQVATPEEVVIITGKGSEPLMCLAKGRKISWSDKQIVEDKVKKLS